MNLSFNGYDVCCATCNEWIKTVATKPEKEEFCSEVCEEVDLIEIIKKYQNSPWVGKKLYGYCNGFFGRDSYGDKTIIAVGYNWVVCLEGGYPITAVMREGWSLEEHLQEWSKFTNKTYY